MPGKSLGALYGQLGLRTAQWDRAIKGAHADLKKLEVAGVRASRRISSSLKSTGRQMQSVGRTMSMAMSVPIGLMGGAAVKAAGDFEEAMVEVEKVTNPETARLMGQRIKEMAEVIPLAQTELAELVSQAARFGVRGVKNIEAFSTAVAKMSIATDLSASRAGEALARVSKLTRVPATEIENLGSAVNELSNNFATSAQEIVDSMLRAGAAGAQFGLNAQQLAGVSAALNAVSESSQRAGTRLRRLFQNLLDPKRVGEIANAIGMTKTAFQDMVEASPIKVVRTLIQAMKEGGEEANNLRTVLVTTSRQALAGLAQNSEEVISALNQSARAYRRNISLQDEFDKATRTFYSQLKILRNQVTNLGIEIGNILLPHLKNLVSNLQEAADFLNSLNEEALRTAMKIAGITAVVGPLVAVTGFLVSGLGSLVSAFGSLLSMAGSVVTFFASFGWPAVLGVAGIAGAATLIVSNWDKVVNYFQNEGSKFLDPIKDIIEAFKSIAVTAFQRIFWAVQTIWKNFGSNIVGAARNIFNILSDVVATGLNAVNIVVQIWRSFFTGEFNNAFNDIVNSAYNIFGSDGLLVSIFEHFVKGDPLIVPLGNMVSRALGVTDGYFQNLKKQARKNNRELKQNAQQTVSQIEDVFMGLGDLEFSFSDLVPGGSLFKQQDAQFLSEETIKTIEYVTNLLSKDFNKATQEATQSWDDFYKNIDRTMALLRGKLWVFDSMEEEVIGTARTIDEVVEKWKQRFKEGAGAIEQIGAEAVRKLSGMFGELATSLGANIGRAMAGVQSSFATGFEKVILIVLDFAKKLASIVGAIGGILLFINPALGAKLLVAATALSAIAAGFEAGINKRIENRRKRSREEDQSVGDALIKDDGTVIELHPNDDVLAMQNMSDAISPVPTGGAIPSPSTPGPVSAPDSMGRRSGGSKVMIENILNLDGKRIWRNQKEVSYKKKR